MKLKLLGAIILLIVIASCGQDKILVEADTAWQKQMNADFKDATKSPLSNKDRKDFTGLDFYKFDSTYVVTARLTRTPSSKIFKMKTTKEDRTPDYKKYGTLRFVLKDSLHTLSIYQGIELLTEPGYEDYLFLPFLDDTNGGSTYGGGRYIDARLTDKDSIIIDFNKAYNPYCAYNTEYSCPIVPRENYLPLSVEVGVKAFKMD